MWFMIKVTFGEHNLCNLKSEPESRYVIRAISRPFNIASYDDDIALLRLNDRVPINHIIRPICLPGRRGLSFKSVYIFHNIQRLILSNEISILIFQFHYSKNKSIQPPITPERKQL